MFKLAGASITSSASNDDDFDNEVGANNANGATSSLNLMTSPRGTDLPRKYPQISITIKEKEENKSGR